MVTYQKKVDQCINFITYNFVNSPSPYYLNEIFEFDPHCRIGARNSFSKLKNPFRKRNMGQVAQFLILVPLFGTTCLTQLKERCVYNVFMWICVSVFIYVCMSVGVCIYTDEYIFRVFYFNSFILMLLFFFSITLFSHFRSDLREHNENKAFLSVLCYPSHCWCY